jgi:RNA polymerase sigma-70 factor (ECF subfamily)
MSGNPASAKDLAQDVFIRAWQKLHTFRGESQASTWLRRLAVNVCLNWLEQEKRRSGRHVDVADLSVFEERVPRSGDAQIDLERAIGTLPPNARSVFVLHDVEGYKHQDIAKMSGVAVGTVKAQLHRARKLLQQRLAK